MIRNLCLTISRFAVAAWVGAAVLFVVTSLMEVLSPELDSTTKTALALLRFPAYYACGFVLLITALIGGLVTCRTSDAVGRATKIAVGLLTVALLLMLADYIWIYGPIVSMIEIPQAARPANFQDYHKASMYINTADVGLCFVAALLLCRPTNQPVH